MISFHERMVIEKPVLNKLSGSKKLIISKLHSSIKYFKRKIKIEKNPGKNINSYSTKNSVTIQILYIT